MEMSLLVKVIFAKQYPPSDVLEYVCEYILPFLLRFFEKHIDKISSITSEAKKICSAIMDATYLLVSDDCCGYLCEDETLRLGHRLNIGRLLSVMHSLNIKGLKQTPEAIQSGVDKQKELQAEADQKGPKTRRRGTVRMMEKMHVGAQVSREERVWTGLRGFCHFFADSFSGMKEQIELAKVMSMSLQTCLPKLVQVMHNHEVLHMDLVVLSLQAIGSLLESALIREEEEEESDESAGAQSNTNTDSAGAGEQGAAVELHMPLDELQRTLDGIGVTQLLLRLMESGINEFVESSLGVGVLLLHGGNRRVQDTIYEVWEGEKGNEQFFIEVRNRIRKAMIEVKERQEWHQRMSSLRQQKQLARAAAAPIAADAKSLVDELANFSFDIATINTSSSSSSIPGGASLGDGGGSTVSRQTRPRSYSKAEQVHTSDTELDKMLREFDDEADQPYPEQGYIKLLLRFLQLLCEGHNLNMQVPSEEIDVYT